MTNSTSYKIGKWFGEQPTVGKLFFAALISLALYHSCSFDVEQDVKKTNKNPTGSAALTNSAKKLCEETFSLKKQEFADLMSKKQYWAAANHIRSCAYHLDNEEVKNLLKEAEVASHLSEINNPKLSPKTRGQAMQKLAKDYPEFGEQYAKQGELLLAEADKKEREAERKRKKSEGVSIGMTKEDVLASSWGKPKSINTTITAYGRREQWVYGSGNYLYFNDDKLTSIQK
jgi:uncharacterized Zn finger protein